VPSHVCAWSPPSLPPALSRALPDNRRHSMSGCWQRAS